MTNFHLPVVIGVVLVHVPIEHLTPANSAFVQSCFPIPTIATHSPMSSSVPSHVTSSRKIGTESFPKKDSIVALPFLKQMISYIYQDWLMMSKVRVYEKKGILCLISQFSIFQFRTGIAAVN